MLAGLSLAQCPQWTPLHFGVGNTTLGVDVLPNGDVVACGVFTSVSSGPANYIARWNGTAWSALGSGLDANVRAVTHLPNGDIIAAGDFSNAGGAPADRIARWDGSNWSTLGAGINATTPHGLYAVTTMPNGDVIAGGYFNIDTGGGVSARAIARWNGSSWSALGSGVLATVFALHVAPNGDLLVGGNFATAGGVTTNRIARWNGSAWSALGSGMTGFRVNAITTMPNGDIVASGAFTHAGGSPAANIARWNGSTWSPLGSGTNGDVLALTALPNGDLIAGGQFTMAGGVAAAGAARWDGSNWSAIGFAGGSQVYAIASKGEAARVFGGFFSSVSGVSAGRIVQYGSSCAATANDDAPGCASSAGLLQLTATALPWVGATFRARGTGLPVSCFVGVVTGFSTANLPLAGLLPAPGVGCKLWVAPDVVLPATPSAGAVDTALLVPADVALVGLPLYQQLLVLELDPITAAILASGTSNRLALTVGWL